ncbi:aminotransferase class III-fold pyridoxal phosphate-dependent enzyme [Lysobacter hankyongensis]
MLTPVEDVSKKILSKQIDKQDAMRLFRSLDKASQLQVLEIVRRADGTAPALDGKRATRPLKALAQGELTDEHRVWIAALVETYERFVPNSRAHALEQKAHVVDPRRAAHPIRDLKPLQFQIAWTLAEGAYVHDADGNRYIDISGDIGANLFGHRPSFLIDALRQSLDQGIPSVGHSETIARACALFCGITGHERALFTHSGADALLSAVRIARAATGRRKLVVFADNGVSTTAGMLQDFADPLIVLDDADTASLDTIEQRAGEIAGVLIEPSRSGQAGKPSAEFLKALRQLTIEKSIALIFDETIAGFRVCTKGRADLRPDMAAYGEIVGGGLPTGVIAGAAKYMDLIDGGAWRSGDDSEPGAKRTGMAGTHSQNPLNIAAALAVLGEIEKRGCDGVQACGSGTCFQCSLSEKTARLADTLNAFFAEERLPVAIDAFGSFFRVRFVDSDRAVTEALFFTLLRMEGVETHFQRDCFLSTAHTDEDIATVIAGVKASLSNLKRSGFFRERAEDATQDAAVQVVAPLPAATAFAPPPQSGNATRRNEMERLKALLAADLALAEESGNY